MVLFLGRLRGSEAEVILHFEEVGSHGRAKELQGLHAAALRSDVDRRVANVIFL